MSDANDNEQLERSLSAMRDAPIPDGPPAKLVADTLAALRSAAENQRRPLIANTLITRITSMRFITKLAAAFLLAAGVTLLAVLTLRPTSVAWADVVAKVADAKALSFKTTTPLPGTDKTMVQRFLMAADGRQRIESGDDQVTIIDAKAGLEMSLDLKNKKAHVARSKSHSYGYPNDPLASLKEMRGKDAREIGEKEFAGRKLKGFACTAGKSEYVVWADPRTGDPVRVEWSLLLPQGKTTMVMDDFKVDAKVDEALLDAKPPKGFEVIEVPTGDEPATTTTTKPGTATKPANVATATANDVPAAEDNGEDHVIAVLRLYADRNDGKLPAKLDDWAAYAKLVKKDRPTEADLMLTTHAASLKFFLEVLGKDTWTYTGEGAKLGDKARVVFDYTNPETKRGRAVYADLTVKEVEATKAPGK